MSKFVRILLVVLFVASMGVSLPGCNTKKQADPLAPKSFSGTEGKK